MLRLPGVGKGTRTMEQKERGELPLAMSFAEQLTREQLEIGVNDGSGITVEMTTWEKPDEGQENTD